MLKEDGILHSVCLFLAHSLGLHGDDLSYAASVSWYLVLTLTISLTYLLTREHPEIILHYWLCVLQLAFSYLASIVLDS